MFQPFSTLGKFVVYKSHKWSYNLTDYIVSKQHLYFAPPSTRCQSMYPLKMMPVDKFLVHNLLVPETLQNVKGEISICRNFSGRSLEVTVELANGKEVVYIYIYSHKF